MHDGFSVSVQGGKELERKLRTLEPKIAKKYLRKVLRAGGKLMLQHARANVPVGETGNLRRSLTLWAMSRKGRSHELGISVGPSSRKVPQLVSYSKGSSSDISTRKMTGERYYYPAAVEYGTRHVAPRPFMRKAFDSRKHAALDVIMTQLRDALEAEAAK